MREHPNVPRVTEVQPGDPPLAFFLTFRTYGTWLTGDERGSVDRGHRTFGTPFRPPSEERKGLAEARLRHAPVELTRNERALIQEAMKRVCRHRGWLLRAVNVRTNHAHVVLTCAVPPEHVMIALKSWATRALIEASLRPPGMKVWARHGSTQYLWDEAAVEGACQYVEHGQDKAD